MCDMFYLEKRKNVLKKSTIISWCMVSFFLCSQEHQKMKLLFPHHTQLELPMFLLCHHYKHLERTRKSKQTRFSRLLVPSLKIIKYRTTEQVAWRTGHVFLHLSKACFVCCFREMFLKLFLVCYLLFSSWSYLI